MATRLNKHRTAKSNALDAKQRRHRTRHPPPVIRVLPGTTPPHGSQKDRKKRLLDGFLVTCTQTEEFSND